MIARRCLIARGFFDWRRACDAALTLRRIGRPFGWPGMEVVQQAFDDCLDAWQQVSAFLRPHAPAWQGQIIMIGRFAQVGATFEVRERPAMEAGDEGWGITSAPPRSTLRPKAGAAPEHVAPDIGERTKCV